MVQQGIPDGQAPPFLPAWQGHGALPATLLQGRREDTCSGWTNHQAAKILKIYPVWVSLCGLAERAGELPEVAAYHGVWCFLLGSGTPAALPCSQEYQQFHFHTQPKAQHQ